MNLKTMRCIIFLFLLSSSCVMGQSFAPSELRFGFRETQVHQEYTFAKNNTNEVQYFFSGLFLFYKFAISSQDNNSCTFSPSCSEFGMLAVKKKGPIFGMLATLDRLQRCNGLSPEKYAFDQEKHLFIDLP